MNEVAAECRMLTESDFPEVVVTMQRGFSDYFVKIEIDEQGYRNKFALEGVELRNSAGAFLDGKMIGVTVNGADIWHGQKTVYDAGTAVVPEYRGNHVSTRMFEMMLPELKRMGFEKYVLEVIIQNEKAIRLYEKFGFSIKRRLGVFASKGNPAGHSLPGYLEFRRIDFLPFADHKLFTDTGLAWQNSNDWLRRADSHGYQMIIFGVFRQTELVGLGAVSPSSGKVQRVAVDRNWSGKGIGRSILSKLAGAIEKPLVVVNLDTDSLDSIGFLEACGFEKTVEQFEMELGF